jgi:hypothetical protein
MCENRKGRDRDHPFRATLRAGVVPQRKDLMALLRESPVRIRFAVMHIIWRIGIPDSPAALMPLLFRAVRRSVDVIASRHFNTPVWRRRSGKRASILSTP